MKHLLIIFTLLLTSVSWSKDVDYNDLVKREADGLYYERTFYKRCIDELTICGLFTGNIKGEINVKVINGKKEGEYIRYDDGKLRAKGFYKDGEQHGEWFYYYKSGQLEETQIWKNGEAEGEWFYYSDNGNLKKIEIWKDDTYEKTMYKNGKKIEGEIKEYYQNGQLKSKKNYKNGKEEGEYFYYYENGQFRSKGNYKNGEREGEYLDYFENGQLVRKVNNKKREWVSYHHNGQLERIGIHIGEPKETWLKYNENGKLIEKKIYKNDIAVWFQYDIYGQIKYSGYHKYLDGEGEREGKWLEYSGGNLRVKRNYKDGKEEGEWMWYDRNGNLKETKIYKDGVLIETIKH